MPKLITTLLATTAVSAALLGGAALPASAGARLHPVGGPTSNARLAPVGGPVSNARLGTLSGPTTNKRYIEPWEK